MAIISNDDEFGDKCEINNRWSSQPAPDGKCLDKSLDTRPEITEFDKNFENNIRPKTFDTYIGQSELKETLKISIQAAKKRELPLDHLLFYGPPGLGKTTLAGVISTEMNVDIKITSAPALERPRDIIGILMSLKGGEILFIDEIHRLNKVAEEILYPAMEDFFLDMTTGLIFVFKSCIFIISLFLNFYYRIYKNRDKKNLCYLKKDLQIVMFETRRGIFVL